MPRLPAHLRDNVASVALAFVLFWFGAEELHSPANWTVFVPKFIGSSSLAVHLVTVHGAVLCLAAAMIVLNYGRRVAAAVVSFLILEIIIDLIISAGLSPIAVRDIGLFGLALSLAV